MLLIHLCGLFHNWLRKTESNTIQFKFHDSNMGHFTHIFWFPIECGTVSHTVYFLILLCVSTGKAARVLLWTLIM